MGKKRLAKNKWKLDVHLVGGRVRETFYGNALEADKRILFIKEAMKKSAYKKKVQSALRFQTFGDAVEFYVKIKKPKALYICKKLYQDLGTIRLTELNKYFSEYLYSEIDRSYNSNSWKVKFAKYANAIIEVARDHDNSIVYNPISRIVQVFNRAHPIPKRNRVLSDEEVKAFFKACKNRESNHLIPICFFAMMVPARKMELVNLNKRTDLDRITDKNHGEIYFVKLQDFETKSGEPAWKIVPQFFNGYLNDIPKECEYVFYKEVKGEYRTLGDFKKSFRSVLNEAGIVDFRFHDFRHMATTRLSQFGADALSIQRQGNWSDIKMVTHYHKAEQTGLIRGILPIYLAMESELSNIYGHHCMDTLGKIEKNQEIGDL